MKKKQDSIFKFIYLLVFIFSTSFIYGKNPNFTLLKADSLFLQKKYVQSFDLYQDLFNHKVYSESMLLKMAFIQEGLGDISHLLYYLYTYYLSSGDYKVFEKVKKIVNTNQLQGHKIDVKMQVRYFIKKNNTVLNIIFGTLIVVLLGILLYQKKYTSQGFCWVCIFCLLLLGIFFVHVNFPPKINRGIVSRQLTYLMDSPSSGASVVDIIHEGDQVEVKGKKDVWLSIYWHNQIVYIKKNQVLLINL